MPNTFNQAPSERLVNFSKYVVCLQGGVLVHLVQVETEELAKFLRIRWRRAGEDHTCRTRDQNCTSLQRNKVRARFLRKGEEVCRLWFDHEQLAEIFCRLWEAESPRNVGEWRVSSWMYGTRYLKDPAPPVKWGDWKPAPKATPPPELLKQVSRKWKGYQPF